MDVKKKQKAVKRYYSPKTLKILFGISHNECAHPDCTQPIIQAATPYSEAAVIGQIAHIYAASDKGPRGKPGLTEKEKNHPDNLLLCCPTHHTVVDTQYETYPAALLLKWKELHQLKFKESLGATINDVGFLELETAARALMNNSPAHSEGSLQQIPPEKKITKNNLGPTSTMLLQMGAAKSAEVEDVLTKAAQLDGQFPDRLREGFIAKYDSFYADALRGDDLFFAMYDWAGGSGKQKSREAAGLCILSHLFIICDVFEK